MAHIKQKCDFCEAAAVYDGKTVYGPWAFMCEAHLDSIGVKVAGMYKALDAVAVSKKVCVVCGQEKPVTDFYAYTDSRGVRRYRGECKECNLKAKKVQRFKKG